MRYAVIILILICFGCSNKAKRNTNALPKETIASNNKQAQEDFDRIVADLELGEFDGLSDRLRAFQTTYANDALAPVAEMYLGRVLTETEPGGQGLAMLQGLSADTQVDSRIRWSATAYVAAAMVKMERQQEAFQALRDYPGPSVSPLVLKRDRSTVLALIAESFDLGARYEDALIALAALWEEGESKTFAVSRGFEIAPRLEEAELEALTSDKSSGYLRAISGVVLLEKWLNESTSRRQRKALREVLNRIEPDLAAIEASDRGQTLDARISAFGPAEKVVIGVVLPLSGSNARVGEKTLQSALVAVDAFNETSNNVTMLVKDSAEDPKSIFSFFEDQKVSFVIGPLDSRRAKPLAEQASAYQIPLFVMSNFEDTDWSYQFFVDPTDEARRIAQHAFAKGDRKFAILVPDIGYGSTMRKAFKAEIEKLGGDVVVDTTYKRSSTDYTKIAKRVADKKPDAVFIPDTGSKVAEISAFFAHANMWGYRFGAKRDEKRHSIHYLGTSLWYGKALVRQSSKYVDGAIIPSWTAREFDDASSKSFYEVFDSKVRREPTVIDAFVYDAVKYAIRLCESEPEPEAAANALKTTPFSGVTGSTKWTEAGLSTDIRFVELSGGKFRTYESE